MHVNTSKTQNTCQRMKVHVYIEVPGGHFSLKDARTVLPNVMANLSHF